jgi:hypothetical protein
MMHIGTLAVPTQRDGESSPERRDVLPSIDFRLPCRLCGTYRPRGVLIDRCGPIDTSVQNLADSPTNWVVDET